MSAHVAFPQTLELKKLQHLLHESDREREMIDGEFELFAVLVHSGPQLGYGHYYALVKAADGRWYRCNDSSVKEVSVAHVMGEQGYIVFYRRKTSHLMKCELKRMQQNVKSESEEKMSAEKVDLEAERRKCLGRIREQSEIMKGLGSGVRGDLDESTMARMVEVSERMANEKVRLRRIESAQSGNKGCNGVDMEVVTDDYFARKCGGREKEDGVMVEREEDIEDVGMSGMADRASYVKVPPMAQRPVVREKGDGSPEAVELFWPPTLME